MTVSRRLLQSRNFHLESEALHQRERANAAERKELERQRAKAEKRKKASDDFTHELAAFLAEVRPELDWADELLRHAGPDHAQHARRARVRASFAFFEGVLSILKNFLLAHDADEVTVKELAALRAETYQVDSDGKVKCHHRRRRVPLSPASPVSRDPAAGAGAVLRALRSRVEARTGIALHGAFRNATALR